jgi:hypothetical protein
LSKTKSEGLLEKTRGTVNPSIYKDSSGQMYTSAMRKLGPKEIKQSEKVNLKKAQSILKANKATKSKKK